MRTLEDSLGNLWKFTEKAQEMPEAKSKIGLYDDHMACVYDFIRQHLPKVYLYHTESIYQSTRNSARSYIRQMGGYLVGMEKADSLFKFSEDQIMQYKAFKTMVNDYYTIKNEMRDRLGDFAVDAIETAVRISTNIDAWTSSAVYMPCLYVASKIPEPKFIKDTLDKWNRELKVK